MDESLSLLSEQLEEQYLLPVTSFAGHCQSVLFPI